MKSTKKNVKTNLIYTIAIFGSYLLFHIYCLNLIADGKF